VAPLPFAVPFVVGVTDIVENEETAPSHTNANARSNEALRLMDSDGWRGTPPLVGGRNGATHEASPSRDKVSPYKLLPSSPARVAVVDQNKALSSPTRAAPAAPCRMLPSPARSAAKWTR